MRMPGTLIFCICLITIINVVTAGGKDYDGHSSLLFVENTNIHNTDDGGNFHLVFHPNMLDFQDLAVGDAEREQVIVFNEHANKSVYFGSISGNVPDFYSSFFEEKVIPPMGNTTFNVVFLPRQPGIVQTNLLIHTSFGAFNYTVKGRGVECMFRLNPLVGLRAPLNATLTPEIIMYNPYETPLQILEVYSSGGQFQLELPGGSGSEGPQALWQIPPYSSKPVIRVRFTATQPGNHSAYIRIKVSAENNSQLEDVVLVVPIEVEIYNHTGIYTEKPILNFGFGGTEDKPKKLVFDLLNSGKETVNIQKYMVEGDSNVSRGIFLSIATKTDSNNVHSTVTVSIDWSAIKSDKYVKGSIAFVCNEDVIYRIPFVGEILKGSIYFNESNTKFVTTQNDQKVSNDFLLKNNYKVPLAVTNITLPEDCSLHFEAREFIPKLLEPGEQSVLFKISLRKSTVTLKHLLLHTNINTYEIPVSSYNGLLRRIVPIDESTSNGIGADEKSINFGTVSVSTLSDMVIAFVNDNPVPITIHNWTGTISGVASIYVILRGCGNLTMENLKFCYFIQPGEWIVFQVSALSNAVGTFIGKLTLKTDYEELSTPIKFRTAMGHLQFNTETLDELSCFPGGTCTINMTVFSTFNMPMVVEQIFLNVSGVTYDYPYEQFPAIAPNKFTHIGQLKFNPKSICGDECYLEFPDRWPPTIISSNCKQVQKDLMSAKLEEFRAMKESFLNLQIRIETSQVRRLDFNSGAILHWPQLVTPPVVFPLLLAGQEVISNVILNNPTNDTIKAYFMLHDVAQNGPAMTYPPEVIDFCWGCFLTRDNVFSLVNETHRNQQFNYIAPRSSIKIPIRFSAETPGNYATLLYIRNNFTVLEAVWLTAKAGAYQFKFGNRKPGSTTPLLFELSDKHLRDCDRKQTPDSPPIVVTAKRSFTARNTGDIPILIESMFIGGQLCEGFGFRIIQCWPFELAPNGSTKIDIAFTPDFTLTRVTQILTLKTSLDYPVNYTLLSMIPGQALGACSKALQRPSWEQSLQLTLLVVLGVSLFFVIFVAFLDSDKVLKDHVYNISKDKGPVQPTLDLRQIGLQTVMLDEKTSPIENKLSGIVCQRKKQDKKRSDADTVNKKSWADVLTKRFSPIQSDVKFKEDTPPPQPIRPVESKREKQKHNRDHEVLENIKFIEDDSSSTTTENSQQSSSDTSTDGKKCTPSFSKKPNVSIDTTSDIKLVTKSKTTVKKTKSLPISSAVNNKEPEVIIPKLPRPTPTKILNAKLELNGSSTETKRSIDILNDCHNFNATTDQPKLQLQPKKYGRTPGRERKKNEVNRRPTQRGALYKDTAFQFASPAASTSPASPPIWDINKISFSNVVAQNPFTTSLMANNNRCESGVQFYNENSQPMRSSCKYDQEVFQNVSSNVDGEISEMFCSSALGPIGTRKSPSSTPVWEPMPCIKKPIPTSIHSNPNSFFSGSFPHYTSVMDETVNNSSDVDLMTGAPEMAENVYGTKRSFDSTLLCLLQQQQRQGVSKLQSLYTNQNNLWGVNLSPPEKNWFGAPIRPPPGLKPLHEKNVHFMENPYNEHHRQQNINTLPPFDPFSSLSSIWSTDGWPATNTSNTEDNRKQM